MSGASKDYELHIVGDLGFMLRSKTAQNYSSSPSKRSSLPQTQFRDE